MVMEDNALGWIESNQTSMAAGPLLDPIMRVRWRQGWRQRCVRISYGWCRTTFVKMGQ